MKSYWLNPVFLTLLLLVKEALLIKDTYSNFNFYSHDSGQDSDSIAFVPLNGLNEPSRPHFLSKRALPETADLPPASSATPSASSSSSPSSSSSSDSAESSSEANSSKPRGWKTNQELVDEVDITQDQLDKKVNESLSEHKDNVTDTRDDMHKYYQHFNVENYGQYWVDLDALNATHAGIVREHPMLSKSYRRAATINLNFHFPFYGHDVDNITIATGGFLYTGQYVHSWLAATQYIAPLMANFDTSLDERAKIRYADNGTALIVEWVNVHLQGQTNNVTTTEGPFTFQVILHKTGDIIFVYKEVPLTISTIADEDHPVKVGLSDAYIIDRTIFFVRRKTIYEYHRVNLKSDYHISNETAIYFKALMTCNRLKSCDQCLAQGEDIAALQCKWCHRLNMCSDGMDRNRQEWLHKGCEHSYIEKEDGLAKCQESQDNIWHSNDDNGYNNGNKDKTKDFQDDYDESYGNANGMGEAEAIGGKDNKELEKMETEPNNNQTVPEEIESPHINENYTEIVFNESLINNNEKNQLEQTAENVAEMVTVLGPEDIPPHHVGLALGSILAFMICSLVAWFGYAYFFPHTWSGQLLIKYRPSRWLNGRTHYTAASSIHM